LVGLNEQHQMITLRDPPERQTAQIKWPFTGVRGHDN
jgi:hypothetical protein